MLNIPYRIKELLQSDSVYKNFRVEFPNGEYSGMINDKIVSQSVKFIESVCSGDFHFGLCESPAIEFETVGVPNISGMIIKCSMEVDCTDYHVDIPGDVYRADLDKWVYVVPYGVFRVSSCERQSELNHRKVVAYGVSDWENLTNVCDLMRKAYPYSPRRSNQKPTSVTLDAVKRALCYMGNVGSEIIDDKTAVTMTDVQIVRYYNQWLSPGVEAISYNEYYYKYYTVTIDAKIFSTTWADNNLYCLEGITPLISRTEYDALVDAIPLLGREHEGPLTPPPPADMPPRPPQETLRRYAFIEKLKNLYRVGGAIATDSEASVRNGDLYPYDYFEASDLNGQTFIYFKEYNRYTAPEANKYIVVPYHIHVESYDSSNVQSTPPYMPDTLVRLDVDLLDVTNITLSTVSDKLFGLFSVTDGYAKDVSTSYYPVFDEKFSGEDLFKIISGVFELNASFAYMNRSGSLTPKFLSESVLFPADYIYPSDNLLPVGANGDTLTIGLDSIKSLWYEESIKKFTSASVTYGEGTAATTLSVPVPAISQDSTTFPAGYATLNDSKWEVQQINWTNDDHVIFKPDNGSPLGTNFSIYYEWEIDGMIYAYGEQWYYFPDDTYYWELLDGHAADLKWIQCTFASDPPDSLVFYKDGRLEYMDKKADIVPYDISDNALIPFYVGSSSTFRDTILGAIADRLADVKLLPVKVDLRGLPYVEAGDRVEITTNEGIIETIVLNQTISGIQSLDGHIEVKGD